MGEKYKNGIYSHNTASYFYGMTDRTPLQLDMTFPSNNRIKNDLLNVHYIKKEFHDVGLTELKLDDGFVIRIYNVERTICDINSRVGGIAHFLIYKNYENILNKILCNLLLD